MKKVASLAAQRRVIDAAREYIAEVENPAPDLVYRRRLRDKLATVVRAHDAETRRTGRRASHG